MKKIIIVLGVVVFVIIFLFLLIQTNREAQEVRIGVILPLTGELASHGEDAKKGIELAIKIKNSSQGIKGRMVKAVYEDDQMIPAVGVSAFQKLITLDNIEVVLGGLSSSVALAMAPIANSKKIVLFSPTASNPELTQKNGFVFRNWPADNYDAKNLANFAYNELKKIKYGILFLNNDNGRALSSLFEKYIEELGGKVLINQAYEAGTDDFRTVLGNFKRLNLDAVYLPGYYEDVAKILVQAKEVGLNVQFLSSSAIENPRLIELAKNAAENLVYSKTEIDKQNEYYKQFAEDFKNIYNSEPGIAAAQCYDAINLIILSIERGGYEGTKIQQELYNIKNYHGVTGETSFDERGDVIKEFTIFTIRNSQFVPYK